MIIVANTTPIISLASINRLDLLEKLFGKIIIAEAVYNEIKAKPSYAYNEIENTFIDVQKIKGSLYKDFLLTELDSGEAETIILAKELNADFVIIDENLGYKIANNVGLNVIRTLSLLLKAKQKGYINEVKPLIDKMRIQGRWYSDKVYYTFLKQAGEL
jgi:predicted nucleic acid-binding protein